MIMKTNMKSKTNLFTFSNRLNSEIAKVLQKMEKKIDSENSIDDNLNIILNSDYSSSENQDNSFFISTKKRSFHSDFNILNNNPFNSSFESNNSNNSEIQSPKKKKHNDILINKDIIKGKKKNLLFSSFSPFRKAKGQFVYAPSSSFINSNNNNNCQKISSMFKSNILLNTQDNNSNSNNYYCNMVYSPSNSFEFNRPKENKQFFTPQYKPQYYIREKKKKNLDKPKNKIQLEKIIRQKDKRTTLIIRHIPNKYTLKLLIDELNNSSFKNKYDILSLPLDMENHCNLGYGLINFIDPIHILLFYDCYNGNRWKNFKSEKICELAYAKFQGKEQMVKHYNKGGIGNNEQFYVNYNIPEDRKEIPIEIPIKYLEVFLKFYSYADYEVVGKGKFVVKSF